jgi:hypothetical protein
MLAVTLWLLLIQLGKWNLTFVERFLKLSSDVNDVVGV